MKTLTVFFGVFLCAALLRAQGSSSRGEWVKKTAVKTAKKLPHEFVKVSKELHLSHTFNDVVLGQLDSISRVYDHSFKLLDSIEERIDNKKKELAKARKKVVQSLEDLDDFLIHSLRERLAHSKQENEKLKHVKASEELKLKL